MKGESRVAYGWYIYDLLRGKPCEPKKGGKQQVLELDFSRAEGKVFVLTRRKLRTIEMKLERMGDTLRLRAWGVDGEGEPFHDPLPFDVALRREDGSLVFRKFSALSLKKYLDIKLPEGRRKMVLSVRDLLLGCRAATKVRSGSGTPVVESSIDIIGDGIYDFLHNRRSRVFVLLGEGQEKYRESAEEVANLLRKNGREVKVARFEPAEVRELPLRWAPLEEDRRILESVMRGKLFAWRINLESGIDDKGKFDRPDCGYSEYGPPLMMAGDAVFFGEPSENRALEQLRGFLPRVPTPDYPSKGRFFLHYILDPFLGGYTALYIGCRDSIGALRAVEYLKRLRRERKEERVLGTSEEVVKGGVPSELEDVFTDRLGSRVLDMQFSPSGRRIFVSLDSFGDKLFVFDSSGEIVARPDIGSYKASRLRPINDEEAYLTIGGGEYLLRLGGGLAYRLVKPYHGLPRRVKIQPHGSVLYRDVERGRIYFGGKCQLVALDSADGVLWRYDDADYRTTPHDMLYRRSIFIHHPFEGRAAIARLGFRSRA